MQPERLKEAKKRGKERNAKVDRNLNRIRAIAVVGTPGVGKTTLCSHLKRKYGYDHVDVGQLVKRERLYRRYDSNRKTYIADIPRLEKEISKVLHEARSNLVLIDGSYAHDLVPRKPWVGIFLIRLNPVLLYRRLAEEYGRLKAKENSIAEFLGVIPSELVGLKNVVEVDASDRDISQMETIFRRSLKNGFKGRTRFKNWTAEMKENETRRYLRVVEN